jgi:hypothetical protein
LARLANQSENSVVSRISHCVFTTGVPKL